MIAFLQIENITIGFPLQVGTVVCYIATCGLYICQLIIGKDKHPDKTFKYFTYYVSFFSKVMYS